MAKLTLSDLASLANQSAAIATINANNALIETALENTLSRDGTSPNTMEANLDMNSNRIINLPLPSSNTEPVRKGEFDETIADLVIGELDAVDAGSLSVIVDGGTEERPLDEHIAKIGLTPKDFGATGGGSVNDTVAVQACYAAAIDLGLPVLIDDIYLVNAAITIDGPVKTCGYGWGTSQLWFSNTTANLFEYNTLTPPHFEDIQIVGPNNGTASLKTAGAFFRVDGDCQFPTWRNCRFIFGFNTWNFDEANSWTIDSCFALGHANNGRGILLNNVGDIGSGEINISNSLIAGDNTARTGIGVLHGGGVNVKIVNSEFYQWDDGYQFNGTEAGGTGSVYITNSVFSQCTRDIVLTKGSATSFTDLSILGNQLYGVNPIVQTGTGTPWLFNTVINNNMITAGITKFDASGTAGVGVALTSVATFTMTGNTFTATNAASDRCWTIGSDALDGVIANNAYRNSILQGVSSAVAGEVLVQDFRSSGLFNTGSTFYAYDATVLPTSNDGAVLGAATQAWADLFLASGAVINFNNGNTTLTHSAGGLSLAGFLNITRGSAVPLQVINNADLANNQVLRIESDRATPTNNDTAYMSIYLSDNAGTQTEYGRIMMQAADVTDTSEDGTWLLYQQIAGTLTNTITSTNTTFRPGTNDLLALGTATISWADLFLASGAVINFNNGNATITHSAGLLTVNVPVTSSGLLTGTGFTPTAATVGGNRIYLPTTNTIGICINGAGEVQFDASATSPMTNDGNALGTTALGWADLHLATGGVINWANGEVTITETDANTLTFAGASSGYFYDAALAVVSSTAGLTAFYGECTDAGAAAGPFLNLFRNSASPAAADVLGAVVFDGKDSGGTTTRYAQIQTAIVAATDGAEIGRINFHTTQAGTSTAHMALERTATATHTALLIWDNDNATLERVTVGAADSAGAGFKVLRIPN